MGFNFNIIQIHTRLRIEMPVIKLESLKELADRALQDLTERHMELQYRNIDREFDLIKNALLQRHCDDEKECCIYVIQ